jgi:hypothetical protein
MNNTKRIICYLTNEQHETLRTLAFNTRLPITEHIRKAVNEYLKHQK